VPRLADADREDRHARLEEHVVVVGREHEHDVRAPPGRAVRHRERDVRVVRDIEAADQAAIG
jgi:hypothetical protein